MQLGGDVENSVIEERMKQQQADQCVSVIFSVSSLVVLFNRIARKFGGLAVCLYNLQIKICRNFLLIYIAVYANPVSDCQICIIHQNFCYGDLDPNSIFPAMWCVLHMGACILASQK